MLSAVVDLLCCPVCRAPFECADRTLWCTGGHSFDISKQGYVSLLGGGGAVFVRTPPRCSVPEQDS
ncbi:putative RNA methyltransferase [Williamsia sp. DF01-3]|uniref:putative RNA methyltransferase n=1 Tax=Williamsia sp. DF01-3 TaxID=2934157 RepID=UPI0035B00848